MATCNGLLTSKKSFIMITSLSDVSKEHVVADELLILLRFSLLAERYG